MTSTAGWEPRFWKMAVSLSERQISRARWPCGRRFRTGGRDRRTSKSFWRRSGNWEPEPCNHWPRETRPGPTHRRLIESPETKNSITRMTQELTRQEAVEHVREITSWLPREECRTCECFLGFITQLELDSEENALEVFSQFRVDRRKIHGCLGCDPCPPGSAFSEYLKKERKK